MNIDLIFSLIILIFSIVIHEVAHGFVARAMGDMTAERLGRLTLNPIKHLDLFGSIILPITSFILGGFVIGWAKPVPYNPYNLSDQRWGEAKVAAAGPLSNIAIALFFGLIIRFTASMLPVALLYIFALITVTNLVLAMFNLIPIPPLDGSKILYSLFPNGLSAIRQTLEQYGFIILIFFIFFLWKFVVPIVEWEFSLITGIVRFSMM